MLERTNLILEKYKNKKNITQTELSKLTGISRGYLSHILTGNKQAKFSMLEKLCEVLEVSPEDQAKIKKFEAFLKTPEEFQNDYWALEKKYKKVEADNKRLKRLEEFETLIIDYVIMKEK